MTAVEGGGQVIAAMLILVQAGWPCEEALSTHLPACLVQLAANICSLTQLSVAAVDSVSHGLVDTSKEAYPHIQCTSPVAPLAPRYGVSISISRDTIIY